jgi:GDPmannose 4,6-dehydratase
MSNPKAIITGVSGQDGSLLAKSLLDDGYAVFGTSGARKSLALWRLNELGIADHHNLTLLDWDITNPEQTRQFLESIKPVELYNLASHSFVGDSLFNPQNTTLVTALAPINIMEAINSVSSGTRFFQAGSSEMFGSAISSPQNEESVFLPRNIYGSAKAFAHSATFNYRRNRKLFTASGILYNHESHLRGNEFVTRKITSSAAKVKLNLLDQLRIGNLSSQRDWGYAPEYVEAMRRILGHDTPEDFVVATGAATTVRSFVKAAFNVLEIDLVFEGQGVFEVGFDKKSGKQIVTVDKEFYRESESVTLVGDPSKARNLLGWHAETSVEEIVNIMVSHDLDRLRVGSNG